jgi:hypothetical protein
MEERRKEKAHKSNTLQHIYINVAPKTTMKLNKIDQRTTN